MNVLLVEDDPAIARGLQVNLELEGFRVLWAESLSAAHKFHSAEKLDLVVLDLGLPDGRSLSLGGSDLVISSLVCWLDPSLPTLSKNL